MRDNDQDTKRLFLNSNMASQDRQDATSKGDEAKRLGDEHVTQYQDNATRAGVK